MKENKLEIRIHCALEHNLESRADGVDVRREAIRHANVEGGDEDPEGEPADDEGDDEDAHLDEHSSLARPSEENKPFSAKILSPWSSFTNLHEDETTPPPFGTVPVEVVDTPDTDDTDVSKRRRAWCDCGLKQYVGDLIYFVGEAESQCAQRQWDYVQCERSPPSSHTIINRAGTTFYPLCRADS